MEKERQRQDYDFWKVELFEGMDSSLVYYDVVEVCWKDRRISVPQGLVKHSFSSCQKQFEIELIIREGVFHTTLYMGGAVIPQFKGRGGTSE
ncbi:hypothetical protein CAEBREN_09211 [Caenorhabditis brenneri]|uniref:Uncharacterized protein n=1 Tax=Caenorhabditis brenneri TaxID=135651 RepID=G0NHY6_CAEBE|nr:hypothetical protein CAEBREN_09211 [Caenorhabditis brenneri]